MLTCLLYFVTVAMVVPEPPLRAPPCPVRELRRHERWRRAA